jgi:predicted transcriptional regulator
LNALRDTTKTFRIKHLVDEGVPVTNQVKKAKKGQQQKPASKVSAIILYPP